MPVKYESSNFTPSYDKNERSQLMKEPKSSSKTTGLLDASTATAIKMTKNDEAFSDALKLSVDHQSESDVSLISTSMMRPECEFNT